MRWHFEYQIAPVYSNNIYLNSSFRMTGKYCPDLIAIRLCLFLIQKEKKHNYTTITCCSHACHHPIARVFCVCTQVFGPCRSWCDSTMFECFNEKGQFTLKLNGIFLESVNKVLSCCWLEISLLHNNSLFLHKIITLLE